MQAIKANWRLTFKIVYVVLVFGSLFMLEHSLPPMPFAVL
ncbi:hypothetical protein Bphyt_7280 (plasmid) [Paraburkholderia phytofirmans PsJN]|uniref:Uncharacterized protein n=1 Tax=Paraburkholderia phytofirmans (strain DSM 17436 / LMG 22146 / PsJN) TaxID=398527 RepID=B2TH16_PARPJ|nr:hypothetical protein Bphyt_7280 [Paraburkholderia phytofirmans PsJN]